MARSSLFRHILVPHDFSNPATLALKTAARLAKEHGGKLTVLHVLVPFYLPADVPFGMPAEGDLVPEQRKQLHRLVTKALGRGGPPITVRVEIGEASQRIIDASRRADSIVMATSGRTGRPFPDRERRRAGRPARHRPRADPAGTHPEAP
jgi:nucleotide-binding universal stress UspA family protein